MIALRTGCGEVALLIGEEKECRSRRSGIARAEAGACRSSKMNSTALQQHRSYRT